jgi:hypothetical protein
VSDDTKEPKEPLPPRLRVTKGAPWRIDPGRRAKWSAPEFVSANAVEVRQIGDPVLHAPAKKPRLSRPELEALVARMFASMVVAHGIGIAAPQIGVALRVAIMDVDEAGIVAIEPTIEWTSEEKEARAASRCGGCMECSSARSPRASSRTMSPESASPSQAMSSGPNACFTRPIT